MTGCSTGRGIHISAQLSAKESHAKLGASVAHALADAADRRPLRGQAVPTLVAAGLPTSEAQAVLAGGAADSDATGYVMTMDGASADAPSSADETVAEFKETISGRRK